jgi:hypothetical protein
VSAASSEEPKAPRTFAIPKRGERVVVEASADLDCKKLRTDSREFEFPEGATSPSVSPTGKTICFNMGDDLFCHTSGTSTGFCSDWVNNVEQAVGDIRRTAESDFITAFIVQRRSGSGHITLSGHSQGAFDVSRLAGALYEDDQLILLQPPAAALYPPERLTRAIERGARVFIGWSPTDKASIGIRQYADVLPLTELAAQSGPLHNAPNARDLFHRAFEVEATRTVNPALDASILSNPGSPRGAWSFPAWADD